MLSYKLNFNFRLTPVYLVVLGIAIASIKRNKQTSLFHITERADEICEKYWWRNVFFINNLFRSDEMVRIDKRSLAKFKFHFINFFLKIVLQCLSWSWYLSTDMQFFLIGTVILILSTRLVKFKN